MIFLSILSNYLKLKLISLLPKISIYVEKKKILISVIFLKLSFLYVVIKIHKDN